MRAGYDYNPPLNNFSMYNFGAHGLNVKSVSPKIKQ